MIDIIAFHYKDDMLGFSQIYHFTDFTIIMGCDDKVNRRAVEDKKVDILMSPEKERKRDFMHYRDSGLNHVLCTLAQKNKVAIGFNFNDVLTSKDKPLVLGKMIQNVMLCRKYKVVMVLISGARTENELRSPWDLWGFGRCLGMTPGELKKALNFEKKKII